MSKYANTTFIVAPGGSISVSMKKDRNPKKKYARTILASGTQVTPKLREECGMTDAKVEEHLRSGFLLAPSQPSDPFATAPGVTVNEQSAIRPDQMIRTGEGNKQRGVRTAAGSLDLGNNAVTVDNAMSDPNAAKQPSQPVSTEGRWTLNPSALEGKSLDELNVMVAERDSSIEPFETSEEAIAHLSQDYAPTAAN